MAIQWPLLIFSLLAGCGGVTLASAGVAELLGVAKKTRFIAVVVALVLLIVGGCASVLHLAQPANIMAGRGEHLQLLWHFRRADHARFERDRRCHLPRPCRARWLGVRFEGRRRHRHRRRHRDGVRRGKRLRHGSPTAVEHPAVARGVPGQRPCVRCDAVRIAHGGAR